MTEDEIWLQAYVQAQLDHIRDKGAGWPEVVAGYGQSAQDALFALVNLGAHVRRITRSTETPRELLLRQLTLDTDDLLAMLLAPGDEADDEEIVARWRRGLADVQALPN